MMRVLIFLLVAMLAAMLTRSEPMLPTNYNYNVPRQLRIGDDVELRIKLTDEALTFSVNLMAEYNKHGYPYNMNYQHKFRIRENDVILNSIINGTWKGGNVPIHILSVPIKAGEDFKMNMYLGDDGIYTTVKRQLTFYPHRLPVGDIKWVSLIDHHVDNTTSITSSSLRAIDFRLAK